jgi:hypothetical protein
MSTHEVFNQSRPFKDVNLYASDPALRRALKAFVPKPELDGALPLLNRVGSEAGNDRMM